MSDYNKKAEYASDKSNIIKNFSRGNKDTGSPEVQIALITKKINYLNKHFSKFKKDHQSKRGLLKFVGRRKRLLEYLKGKSVRRYSELISDLNIRK